MLFDTVAEYDAEIANVRADMTRARKEQSFVSGGPGGGRQVNRGRVLDDIEYLKLLSKERETLLNRQSGMVTQVEFGRER